MEAVRCGNCGLEFSESGAGWSKIARDRYECKPCKRILRPSQTAPTLPKAAIVDFSPRVKELEAELVTVNEKLKQQVVESLKSIRDKEELYTRYRSTNDGELAKLKTDLLEAQEKSRASQAAMAQSASELQYLLSSYKDMQEQMNKQKEKTMHANAKIKELSLRMEFMGDKQVVDAEPPRGLVTYVGFDIEGAQTLWRKFPTEVAAVLPQYLNAVRLTGRQYKGFEMKNSSSSFIYVFPSAPAAVNFAIAVQNTIMNIKYPAGFFALEPSLTGVEEVKGKPIFKGLRVCIGMYTCEGKYETDPVSGWVSPVGDAPAFLEKISATAYGGQILVSAETVTDLLKSPVAGTLVEIRKNLANINVVNGEQMFTTSIAEVAPNVFIDRKYPPLLTEAEQLARKSESIASEVDSLKAENETLKNQLRNLEAKADEANRKAAELQKFLAENQEQNRKTQREQMKRYLDDMAALVSANDETKKALDQAQQKNADLNTYMGELNEQLRDVSMKAKGLNKQVTLLEKAHGPCGGAISSLKHDLTASKVRIKELEDEIARLSIQGETPWGPLNKSAKGSVLQSKIKHAASSESVDKDP